MWKGSKTVGRLCSVQSELRNLYREHPRFLINWCYAKKCQGAAFICASLKTGCYLTKCWTLIMNCSQRFPCPPGTGDFYGLYQYLMEIDGEWAMDTPTEAGGLEEGVSRNKSKCAWVTQCLYDLLCISSAAETKGSCAGWSWREPGWASIVLYVLFFSGWDLVSSH